MAIKVTTTILEFHFGSTNGKCSILTDAALKDKVQGSKMGACDTDTSGINVPDKV